MTPEQRAREKIDRQLERCGWQVQDYAATHIGAGRGVAVREFPLTTGAADYLLYVDGKAIGVVEAKPEGHTLTGVELQSAKLVPQDPNDEPVAVLLERIRAERAAREDQDRPAAATGDAPRRRGRPRKVSPA